MVPKDAGSREVGAPLDTRLGKGEFTAYAYPYPAEGVEVLTIGESRLGERIWIGGVKHGVEVTRHLRFFALDDRAIRPDLFTAFRAIDGNRTIAEIIDPLRLDRENFLRLLGFLEDEGLLYFSSLPHSPRLMEPTTRREVEAHHLPQGATLSSRRGSSIIITSRSTIATTLASLLFGSGLTEVKFLDEKSGGLNDQITELDLGLSIFNGSDVGAQRFERLDQIAHRSAILPLTEDRNAIAPDFRASLTIATGYPRPDHHQRWVSEDRTFIILPNPSQREIRIGPIVIPGITPCLRCHELNQIEGDFWREQVRQLQQLKPEDETSRVAAILTASLAASYILLWIDSESNRLGGHPLYGKQYILDLDTMESRIETWKHHPQCGCLGFTTHSSTPSMKSRA